MSYNEHLTAGLATIWDCTTGEAAERIAPKRKRISQDSLREEIPWTAARCNRLLRTITSRVNILRRQSRLCAAGSSARDAQSSRDVSRHSSEDASPPRKDRKPAANDPEWVPGADTKTSSRTYGGKIKSRQKVASRKADSGFSTPFVKRLLKNVPLSAAKPRPDAINRADERPKKVLQLPVQLASRNEEAQRNLVRAFDSLLVATGSTSGTERVGARSLVGACLRRVPDYIALELEDQDDDNDNNEDIASSIYSELESLGTNSGGGWSGLREVVRSHGLDYVREAIDEGLIQDTRISELVSICSKHGALFEAESLLQTWIARDSSTEPGRVEDSHIALTKLNELRSKHDAPGLYLRHHADLVKSKHIQLSDVLRPGSAPLKDMISGLLRGPSQDAALAYLEAAVIEDYTASDTPSLPVFSRLAGLFASLALAQSGSADSFKPELEISTVVNRIATLIAQRQDNDMDALAQRNQSTSINTKRNTRIHPFSMASALLQLALRSKTPTITTVPMDSLVNAVAAHQNAFVKFAVNVAQHVHRFSDADELESLLITTSGLLAPPPECNDESRSTLNRLGFEIAFAYREQTGVDIDDHFNGRLAGTVGAPVDSTAQTPRRRVQVSGYKWEEGLCEWVEATPLAKPPVIKPQRVMNGSMPPHKQLLTPHKEVESPLVLPPSPRVVVTIQSPPPTDNTTPSAVPARRMLHERSTNHQLPKPLHSSEQKKSTGFLKPTLPPKQVHLKEERAKKAALLAQSAIQAPLPKQARSKRSHSLAHTSSINNGSQRAVAKVETDELGVLTPARKKSKHVLKVRGGGRPSSVRTSLPARTLDVMSEDELGL